MTTWIDAMLLIADTIPGAGRTDPKSLEKMKAELEELKAAQLNNDFVGALTEVADVVYYAAKSAYVGQITESEAERTATRVAGYYGLSLASAVRLAQAKYSWRQSYQKNDAEERRLVYNAYQEEVTV